MSPKLVCTYPHKVENWEITKASFGLLELLRQQLIASEKIRHFGFDSGKNVNFEGGLFHEINLKNNGAIVIPRFSIICG